MSFVSIISKPTCTSYDTSKARKISSARTFPQGGKPLEISHWTYLPQCLVHLPRVGSVREAVALLNLLMTTKKNKDPIIDGTGRWDSGRILDN